MEKSGTDSAATAAVNVIVVAMMGNRMVAPSEGETITPH